METFHRPNDFYIFYKLYIRSPTLTLHLNPPITENFLHFYINTHIYILKYSTILNKPFTSSLVDLIAYRVKASLDKWKFPSVGCQIKGC